jgi:hypothetical protein
VLQNALLLMETRLAKGGFFAQKGENKAFCQKRPNISATILKTAKGWHFRANVKIANPRRPCYNNHNCESRKLTY